MKVREWGQYDADKVSLETGFKTSGNCKVLQSQKEDADINVIVRRFGLTGQLPPNIRTPQYGDFTGVKDYQTALNAVIEADKEFMRLPAEIRKRFDHDPEKLLEFMADENNREEAEKIGLVPKKKASEAATAVPAAAPVATATAEAKTP